MSTMEIEERPAQVSQGDTKAGQSEVRTFRGRTLEELLPKIRAELGPDAVVVRQRDGLMGGVGGFFQQQFVEVEARRGHPRIDVYDEEPATPEPPAERILPDAFTAPDFAALLAAAEVPRDAALDGFAPAFAERLLADAAHELPFAGGDRRLAMRRALARRIPAPLPRGAGELAVAFVALARADAARCADALATAYAEADVTIGVRAVGIDSDAEGAVARAGRELAAATHDELLLVVPAAADLDAARALHDRLAPLAPTGVAVAGEGPAAGAVELACLTRLPLVYVLDADGAIAPADPHALAERLVR